jgi:hypothetical protein
MASWVSNTPSSRSLNCVSRPETDAIVDFEASNRKSVALICFVDPASEHEDVTTTESTMTQNLRSLFLADNLFLSRFLCVSLGVSYLTESEFTRLYSDEPY